MSTSQGVIAESIFLTECLKRNIEILQPFNDVFGYDFAIARNDELIRVQVKSTLKPDMRYPNHPSYKIQCRKGNQLRAYEIGDFDVLAAYIFSEDVFYIIPFREINQTTIRINLRSDKCRFFKYKDAFDLIGG